MALEHIVSMGIETRSDNHPDRLQPEDLYNFLINEAKRHNVTEVYAGVRNNIGDIDDIAEYLDGLSALQDLIQKDEKNPVAVHISKGITIDMDSIRKIDVGSLKQHTGLDYIAFKGISEDSIQSGVLDQIKEISEKIDVPLGLVETDLYMNNLSFRGSDAEKRLLVFLDGFRKDRFFIELHDSGTKGKKSHSKRDEDETVPGDYDFFSKELTMKFKSGAVGLTIATDYPGIIRNSANYQINMGKVMAYMRSNSLDKIFVPYNDGIMLNLGNSDKSSKKDVSADAVSSVDEKKDDNAYVAESPSAHEEPKSETTLKKTEHQDSADDNIETVLEGSPETPGNTASRIERPSAGSIKRSGSAESADFVKRPGSIDHVSGTFKIWDMYKTLNKNLQAAMTNKDLDSALNYMLTRMKKIGISSKEDYRTIIDMLDDVEYARANNTFDVRDDSVPYKIVRGKMDAVRLYVKEQLQSIEEQEEVEQARKLAEEERGLYAKIDEIHGYINDNINSPEKLRQAHVDIDEVFSKAMMHHKHGGKPEEIKARLYNLKARLALRNNDYGLAKKNYTRSDITYPNRLAKEQLALLNDILT